MEDNLEEDPFAPEEAAHPEGDFDDAFDEQEQGNIDDVRMPFVSITIESLSPNPFQRRSNKKLKTKRMVKILDSMTYVTEQHSAMSVCLSKGCAIFLRTQLTALRTARLELNLQPILWRRTLR